MFPLLKATLQKCDSLLSFECFAWKRSNWGNHARFYQNTSLSMQRLQINIQLNPTLYALLNVWLNTGLSITLFSTSIKFKVQGPDWFGVWFGSIHMQKLLLHMSGPTGCTYQEPSLPMWTHIYPKSATEQESRTFSPSWQNIHQKPAKFTGLHQRFSAVKSRVWFLCKAILRQTFAWAAHTVKPTANYKSCLFWMNKHLCICYESRC